VSEFKNVTVVKKANIYFDGNVTSRSVFFEDGTKNARRHAGGEMGMCGLPGIWIGKPLKKATRLKCLPAVLLNPKSPPSRITAVPVSHGLSINPG